MREIRRTKRGGLIAAALAASLTLAPSAVAADFYVDRDVAMTTDPACSAAAPCKTIGEGVALADANDADQDTVHVGLSSAPYAVSLTVPDTPLTLLGGEYNFVGTGTQTIIDGGSAPAITLALGSAARTIRGLTLSGGSTGPGTGVTLEGGAAANVTIESNTFNETSPINAYINVAGSPVIRGNVITGFDDATEWANGISIFPAIAPRITGNSISGIERSIAVFGATDQVTIAGNTLQPNGNDAPSGGGTPGAMGIQLGIGAGGSITDNLVTGGQVLDGAAAGVFFSADGPGTRRLARNRIFGFPSNGVRVQTPDPVTLNGDVIADNSGAGIYLETPTSNVTATNATVWNNDAAAGLNGEILIAEMATLALDSTIVGEDGVRATVGTASCTAIFSRGPPLSQLCQGQFATNSTPVFVDAPNRDFHLTPTGNAALIDMGNPGAAAGVDLDGNPLALDGIANGICLPRRDIGADEVTGLGDGSCATSPLPASPAASRCPKGKKLKTIKKKGKKRKKCVKKKRKR